MSRDIIIGLDIGTSFIHAVVGKVIPGEDKPQIIGMVETPSAGIRKGMIADFEDATNSIRGLRDEIERMAGVPINHAYVSLGGSHISTVSSKGVVAVSRADGEISEEDVERVISAAQAVSLPPNKEIIYVVPREFVVDGEGGIKNALGMSGIRLEVETLLVEGHSSFIKNLTKCVLEAGMEIDDLVVAPLAAAEAVLSKRQKELGVLLLDIGGGTSGMSVFEEGNLVHAKVLPVGASHITNDIAIGLRIGIDTAEKIKVEHGSSLPYDIGKKDIIDLEKISPEEEGLISRRQVINIIEPRLCEIFSLVNEELKAIGREKLLPAGVVMVGGGAKLPGIVDLAKRELKLPSQLGFPPELAGVMDRTDDPSFATSIGLVLWGINSKEREGFGGVQFPYSFSFGKGLSKLKRWVKMFLP